MRPQIDSHELLHNKGYVAYDNDGRVHYAGSHETQQEAIEMATLHCPKDKSWILIHVRLVPRPVVYEHIQVFSNIPTQNDPNTRGDKQQ